MDWRVARSLDVLLGQLNALAPNRSKVSDGAIGDAAHATRDSDHNPWYGPGIVTARDFTNDPAGGLDCNWLANALIASGDGRIKYIIWDHRIWEHGWSLYSGENPHDHHLHLSVVASPACDDTTPWALGAEADDMIPQEEFDDLAWRSYCEHQGYLTVPADTPIGKPPARLVGKPIPINQTIARIDATVAELKTRPPAKVELDYAQFVTDVAAELRSTLVAEVAAAVVLEFKKEGN